MGCGGLFPAPGCDGGWRVGLHESWRVLVLKVGERRVSVKSSDRPVRVGRRVHRSTWVCRHQICKTQSHTFISVFRVLEEGCLRSFSGWHPCTELVILELVSEGEGHALYCSCVLQCAYCLLYTFAFPLDNFSVDPCTKSGIYQCIFNLLCGAEMHSWNTKLFPSQGMAHSCRRPCFTTA